MRITCAALAVIFVGTTAWAQDRAAVLAVDGDVQQKLELTAEDLSKMPRTTVRLEGVVPDVYEGVWLREVLRKAGVPLGDSLRGKALVSYVIAEASDGYRALFSIAEVDASFTKGDILVADTLDNKPLESDVGPFRLVVASDKPGARSVRMLRRLTVVQIKK
jgi:DMSO/TMAO reductase YedYZ molybdopterin-dependent catalytic subunit